VEIASSKSGENIHGAERRAGINCPNSAKEQGQTRGGDLKEPPRLATQMGGKKTTINKTVFKRK